MRVLVEPAVLAVAFVAKAGFCSDLLSCIVNRGHYLVVSDRLLTALVMAIAEMKPALAAQTEKMLEMTSDLRNGEISHLEPDLPSPLELDRDLGPAYPGILAAAIGVDLFVTFNPPEGGFLATGIPALTPATAVHDIC